jgi:ribose/xylose/arabinose/galactoside ABC-type transport system permease subunit
MYFLRRNKNVIIVACVVLVISLVLLQIPNIRRFYSMLDILFIGSVAGVIAVALTFAYRRFRAWRDKPYVDSIE